jgi:hypothetical protein
LAGFEQFADLIGDGLPHAGDVFEFALFPVFFGVPAQRGQAFGGLAVGQGLVNDLAPDLEQVGDQGECVSQFTVVHGYL